MLKVSAVHTGTPSITVVDNRGLTVRSLQFCRAAIGAAADLRLTRTLHSPGGYLLSQSDPRLGDAGLLNISQLADLSGTVLRQSGSDNGTTWALADILGRPLWQRDAMGTVTTFSQDALGRRYTISRQAPGSQALVRERHYYGDTAPPQLVPPERAQTANLRGQTVCIWDSAGQQRVAAVSLSGLAQRTSRRLLAATDSSGDWSGDDAQASTWQRWEAALDTSSYGSHVTLDACGQLLTHTNAAGHIRRQAYDVAGLLCRQWLTLNNQPEQPILQGQTYNAAGRPLTQLQGNGVTVNFTYEAETQRLIGTSITRRRAAKPEVLQALAYTHDPVGNVLTVTDATQAFTWFRNQQISPVSTFTYDSLYQLISASGREVATQQRQGIALPALITPVPADSSQYTAYTRTYSYDRGGNLTQIRHSAPKTGNQWTSTIVVAATANRGVSAALFPNITAEQVDALFDPQGQQLQLQPGQLLSWDADGRVQQVQFGTGADSPREYYAYAGAQRLLKVSEQRSQATLWQRQTLYLDALELRSTARAGVVTEALEVVSLASENGEVRALHWSSGKPDGIANDSIRYCYGNPLGSIELELDQQGNVISREEYYPFGGTALWAASSLTEASVKTRRYSGKERDASGLYYFGYRYYQPWSARWLSPDPAGTLDGLNLYRMARNNPLTLQDPNGLMPLFSFLDKNRVGTLQINGKSVEVRKSPWSNSYQIGKDSRLTFQRSIVSEQNGIVTFNRSSDRESFAALYEKWQQGEVNLIRGISSSHFSWNEIVTDGVVRSEGDLDHPMATMGGSNTRWLPTAMDDAPNRLMVAGIAGGNQMEPIRDAMADEQRAGDVLTGVILKFTVGADRPLPINFLYDGEIVVQGPVKAPDFIVDTVLTGDVFSSIDISSLGSKYDELLPLAAPYQPDGVKKGDEAYSVYAELAQRYLVRSADSLSKIRMRLARRDAA